LTGATTTDIFLSEHGSDSSNCKDIETACRTLRRAMQIAGVGHAVVYIEATTRSTASSWLCREDIVHVLGSVTIKPRPPALKGSARLGCGAGGSDGVRRVLMFNVTGSGATRHEVPSLTLDGLTVEGAILQVRDGHLALVETTLIDVTLVSTYADHVRLDVVNSTWTSRYPHNVTTCEVR